MTVINKYNDLNQTLLKAPENDNKLRQNRHNHQDFHQ